MRSLAFLARRAAFALTTLLVLTIVAFLLVSAARGDPALIALEQDGQTPTPELLATYRRQLGLDMPLPLQYVRWLGQVVQGDFGRSVLTRRPVAAMLGERIWPTLQLGLATLVVSTVVGTGLGFVVAFSRSSVVEVGLGGAVILAAGVPSFLVAIALSHLVAERLRLVPVAGYGSLPHLVLPVVTLALLPAAATFRLTRSAVRSVLTEDFVRTARAKGLSERTIAVHHVARAAAAPLVASIGVRFGHILAGTVIIESIFAWPGMGTTVLTAISGRDLPVIAGYLLLTGGLVITANFATDVITSVIDPRVPLGWRAR